MVSARGLDILEILSEDGGLIFGRGSRIASGWQRQKVLVALPVATEAEATSLGRLAHEYSLRDELKGAWALRPSEFLTDRGQTILLFEDPGGKLLSGLLDGPMGIEVFLRVAPSIAAALRKVHEQGLIHKDIKPSHILVNADSGEVRLTGFGIASRLLRERQAPSPPESIAGTLAYMAPEQTGRMNRSMDSRSDLYSLGVTLYQMLTGALPFSASDPIEWVHCHIARTPIPPSQRSDDIPSPVSEIVMKLLAKTAEERYQTAGGVEHDLRRCQVEWEKWQRIEEFQLAEHDLTGRLQIPEKLYGRLHEIDTLVSTFDRVVTTGVPELVLVSGYSGIGKSSVVNELHKVLVPPRGLFASGKFGQYERHIPYATVVHAFRTLVRQILSKSEAELRRWQEELRNALGENGGLIVNLIPELELLIDKPRPVADLPPQDAQRRFQTVLRRFIAVFARPEHPLALFLDDLQWIDVATLDLIESLSTQSDVGHLLLIGAYRDNEVDLGHPLLAKTEAIRVAGARVQEISLAPLAFAHLSQLISDALRCEAHVAEPLVRLVHLKTGGNPFFSIRFLSSLANEALIVFDAANSQWCWDLDCIHGKGYTDNVVDLMTKQLSQLPARTQEALRQLACVGSGATFGLLGMVCGISQEDLHECVWEAVRTELILRLDDSYVFQHDRIQEAAYLLIPEEVRAESHLRIGRLLFVHTPPHKREEAIFDITGQFNRSAALITSQEELDQVAQLNLLAGKRAKSAAAYSSALTYLALGRSMLATDCWSRLYALSFELEYNLAEAEFLSNDLGAAEERLSVLAKRVKNIADLGTVTSLRVDLYVMLARSERSVEVGLEYFRKLGIKLSRHPTDEDVRQEYDKLREQLRLRSIEDLIDLPLMEDAATLATINVLSKLMPSGNNTDYNLNCLLIARMVNLSLSHGNSDASCLGYASLALVLATDFGEYSMAERLAQLSLDLVDKRGMDPLKSRIYLRVGGAISPLIRHFRFGRLLVARGSEEGDKVGDVLYAGHCRSHLIKSLLASGEPLDAVEKEILAALDFVRRTGSSFVYLLILNKLYFVRTLRGRPLNLRLFDDTEIDQAAYEQYLEADPNLTNPAYAYWTRKMQACVFTEEFPSALKAANRARGMLMGPSPIERAEYHFYSALARAGSFGSFEGIETDERRAVQKALTAHHRQLQIWAQQCPENFENRVALIGAEMARLESRDMDAQRLYEQAIQSAELNGFAHNAALACESAARFYAKRGLEGMADLLREKARRGYLRWGADARVRQLESRYPHLAMSDLRKTKGEMGTPDQQLDVAAVVKASQALSGEMLLPNLIERLMTIAMESAGADRGLLIRPGEGDYRIEAEARADGEQIVLNYGSEASSAVPATVVRYVMRTQETLILDDAAKQHLFSEDYCRSGRARSIFCAPLLRQGAIVGLIYLENALASHVFTPDRARLLELLGSQAAISLENARLYSELQEREAKVRRLVDSNIIGICIVDSDSYISEANDAFLDIVGYGRSDITCARLSFSDLVPSERSGGEVQLLDEIASRGSSEPSEEVLVRKDGSRVPVLAGGASFGEFQRQAVAFVLDLTDRKRAEEELAHANRVATMGQLSASIAHEVNQPLAALLTNAGTAARWLARQPPNLEKAQLLIDRVVGDGKRAADILSRIRDFSKKAPARAEALDINKVVLEILGITRVALSEHRVSLKMELSDQLPIIFADRIQLQQVILNLIMNATEAMSGVSEESRTLSITTSAAESSGVLLAVSDSGPGLSPANAERIFEAFFTTKPSGLGMGLSICRSIVEAHSGRLWAMPNEPHGAIFCVLLPVEK
ncbi:AAA family ATPase [Bradyrhizobium liaoningense]|uniref:trifunctional serine/threonine-protein kinase/ATP-binding protein/sensor histidine kinase n=1 Tax=Bradyrhizobium liaoningense TaxID=43992 RepID=UPI001BADB24F|nr:AAA family ATPase [Bradyrhizobium liaoningense]MBR0907824.1 AAA family ATPase [Bradyrhizobium liaoningense]